MPRPDCPQDGDQNKELVNLDIGCIEINFECEETYQEGEARTWDCPGAEDGWFITKAVMLSVKPKGENSESIPWCWCQKRGWDVLVKDEMLDEGYTELAEEIYCNSRL